MWLFCDSWFGKKHSGEDWYRAKNVMVRKETIDTQRLAIGNWVQNHI